MKRETVIGFVTGLFIGLAFMLCLGLLGGCVSAGFTGDDAGIIGENSRNLGRLEGTAENLGDTIGDSRERLEIVARASEKIADGIDRLEYLFTEYEREVDKLYEEIDRTRSQLESFEKKQMDGMDSIRH